MDDDFNQPTTPDTRKAVSQEMADLPYPNHILALPDDIVDRVCTLGVLSLHQQLNLSSYLCFPNPAVSSSGKGRMTVCVASLGCWSDW